MVPLAAEAAPLQEQEPRPKGLFARLLFVGLKPHASTERASPALMFQLLRTWLLLRRLKPRWFYLACGTAEAVPLQKEQEPRPKGLFARLLFVGL
jgi:hypothetical protein